MVNAAVLIRLDARSGKEDDVATFLQEGLAIVQEEPATTVWFSVRLGPSSFGIFAAFPDQDARVDHLAGDFGSALAERTSELLAQPPVIEDLDVLAAKLSEERSSQAGA